MYTTLRANKRWLLYGNYGLDRIGRHRMARNPAPVIEAVLGELPKGRYPELEKILAARLLTAQSCSPDAWPHIWGTFAATLGSELRWPDEPWKKTIAGYVSGTLPLPSETTEETMS